MAQVRNISGEPRSVPELGSFGGAFVDVDQVVTVPDDRYGAFVSQADLWESVTAPEGEVTDPSIDPAPVDDDLGPIDVGDAGEHDDLGGQSHGEQQAGDGQEGSN